MQKSQPNTFQDRNSISVYRGELTPKVWIDQVKKLKAAFPGTPKEFYDILAERLKENKFSDKRLIDAINLLIDSYIYPVPAIANIISYDVRVKLYTYQDMLKLVDNYGKNTWSQYKRLENGKYAHVSDVEKYQLT